MKEEALVYFDTPTPFFFILFFEKIDLYHRMTNDSALD